LISIAYATVSTAATSPSGALGDWGFIITIAVIIFVYYFFFSPRNKKRMEKRMSNIPNFTATQKVIGIDGYAGLAIDEEREKICLSYPRQKEQIYRIISYKVLLSSEIFEDGVTVSKTMRGSQIGGALIGGVLLGGVGAIIGGLSGKTKTTGSVRKIDLRLTVNDTKSPIFDVTFLNKETKKDNPIYEQAIQSARHWHGLVEVLIKRADMEDKQKIASTPIIQHSSIASVADELKKLADLRDSGVLSDQEFQQQKLKLLG
jgi:preprotein translocase subunit YajC